MQVQINILLTPPTDQQSH